MTGKDGGRELLLDRTVPAIGYWMIFSDWQYTASCECVLRRGCIPELSVEFEKKLKRLNGCVHVGQFLGIIALVA